MSSTIKVALATPLEPRLRHVVADVDPSVDLLVDDSLLPPRRFPGDHEGDPAFRRTPRQQASFERLMNSADVFYGIPDTRPAALAPDQRSARVGGTRFLDVVAVEPLPIESPLWAMPQVVIAPHTAALSPHEDRGIAELFATNLRRLLDGKELPLTTRESIPVSSAWPCA